MFPIEIEYFFEKFLSISFWIRIVSNRTTSISVEVYEYRRYLLEARVFVIVGHWSLYILKMESHKGSTQEAFSLVCRVEEVVSDEHTSLLQCDGKLF
jgi:hypothetical protein